MQQEMTNGQRKSGKGLNVFLFVCAAASVVGMILYVMLFSKWTYHSDCAGYMFLAQEQLAQGKLFPEGFHYTTEIFALSPNLTMIPWLKLFTNRYLIHELGTICYALICIAFIWCLFWDNKRSAALATMLFVIPYSYTYRDMMFFQGAYLFGNLAVLWSLIAVKWLFRLKRETKPVLKVAAWIVFAAVMLLINWYSIRNYLQITLPLLGALLVLILVRRGGRVIEWLDEPKILIIAAFTVVLAFISLNIYSSLCASIGFDNGTTVRGGLVGAGDIIPNIQKAIANILALYGVCDTSSLFSIQTICVCAILAYLFISFIVMPIMLVKNFKKIEDPFAQLLSAFAFIETFLTLFMMVFCNYNIDRYFLPVHFTQLLLYAWFAVELVKKRKATFGYWPITLTLCLAVLVNGSYFKAIPEYWYNQPLSQMIMHPAIENDLEEFFDEHDLDYGYATFWHAYQNMAMINDKVTIVAYDQGSPTTPYFFDDNDRQNPNYYAISEKYYDVEAHPGRCFVLVYPGETIPDAYYELANETIVRDDFTCLIYDYNIHLYPELTK